LKVLLFSICCNSFLILSKKHLV